MNKFFTLISAATMTACSALAAERGDVVAFSLREAQERVALGAHSSELDNLGHISRLAGFVFVDAPGAPDIILVGKVIPFLPPLTMDDLVTGLKARLEYNEWPLVSIDPTNAPGMTNQQVVRLVGHLQDTPWGAYFVWADVALKKICLHLLDNEPPVRSYRDYYEDELRSDAQASGAGITEVSWLSGQAAQELIRQHLGEGIRQTNYSQCRFWFYPLNGQHPVRHGNVFCIKGLRLGVEPEEFFTSAAASGATPGKQFAQAFSDAFEAMSGKPDFSRLKGLYDLTWVAEAIRTNGLGSNVALLVKQHHVTPTNTPPYYPLEQLVGDVRRADGLHELVQLSGGIDFETDLQFLQGGDVKPLREVVASSRPDPHALSWPLPLETWTTLPNMDVDMPEPPPVIARHVPVPGCTLGITSVLFHSANENLPKNTLLFTGFPSITPIGGVSFSMQINEADFEHDKSGQLKSLKEKILQSRTSTNGLSWDIK
jgi:hypothetical protein